MNRVCLRELRNDPRTKFGFGRFGATYSSELEALAAAAAAAAADSSLCGTDMTFFDLTSVSVMASAVVRVRSATAVGGVAMLLTLFDPIEKES